MQTALIIVSIAFVLLLELFIAYKRSARNDAKYLVSVLNDTLEREKEHHKYIIQCEINKAVRYAYGISGDIIHHLSYVLKKDVRYIDLVEELGGYARSIGCNGKPLAYLEHSVLNPDRNYQFAQLDKDQSKQLREFLKDIHDGKRTPDALLELINGLLFIEGPMDRDPSVIRIFRTSDEPIFENKVKFSLHEIKNMSESEFQKFIKEIGINN